MTTILKAGLLYFITVFAVGFVLGSIRVPFLVPRLGERYAELIELPFLLIAIVLCAGWIVRRYRLNGEALSAAASGLIAAVLLILVEFSVVLALRGMSIDDYLEQRDPVAAAAYYGAVAIFAVMPLILSLKWRPGNDE